MGQLLSQVAVFSASQLNQITIFGLGIMPYISASIIFQLLGSVWGPLEQLQKEGESGRKKINEYTRYATVVLCIGQSWAYLRLPDRAATWCIDDVPDRRRSLTLRLAVGHRDDDDRRHDLPDVAGRADRRVRHRQRHQLVIMAGILAGMPGAGYAAVQASSASNWAAAAASSGSEVLIVLVMLFVAVVAGVVFITLGQRRIPTQSAKHVRGRRVYGGTRQYLPLRVNQAGVMPIIFASSLLMFPSMLFSALASAYPDSVLGADLHDAFTRGTSFIYNVLYVVLIYFFCYFWTAITFNPKDMADNLKNFGTFIPGYRPGKRTADYLEKVMVRITYVGAGVLGRGGDHADDHCRHRSTFRSTVASFYGGTGLLIAVSVAFDLVQKIDSHLVMRNYEGLLE